ncbi:hypothetical protein X801_10465 [Opisthorchis viverrini]|uniref:NADH dehydrogenase [ubiquinone] 1 subunit C2 n=1 Tax=Opisthorchis viverrini TaxID=6198 RepID=A0A1S8WH69_OPIVI|nr:hypothetical protein X801_10465 [Opisthorchis viverrini]
MPWLPVILGGFATLGSLATNYYKGWPLYAQFYRTLILGGGAYGIGYGIHKTYERRKHVRLHAIEHYKSMFPDRFPQRISDIFSYKKETR